MRRHPVTIGQTPTFSSSAVTIVLRGKFGGLMAMPA